MNWKFKLMLAGVAFLVAALLVNLPSQAVNNVPSSSRSYEETARQTVTEVNGFSVVKPSGFGVSKNFRDYPTDVSDAHLLRAFYITKNQQRELMLEEEALAKGITKEQLIEEINTLNTKEIKKAIPGAGAGEKFTDPLMFKSAQSNAPQAMPTPSLTFFGNTQTDNAVAGTGAVLPPDTIGDVGPIYYVQAVNNVFSIYNKTTGGRVTGPTKMSNLFSSLPVGSPCRRDDGDPTVNYDQLADRWVLTQFSQPQGGFYQCVAVSQTSDPTGAYYVYQYLYPNNVFNDYPKFGVWRDAYYMTTNEFSGSNFFGAGMCAFDRDKMLQGIPTATLIVRQVATSSGVLPTDIDGFGGPPVDLDHIFLEFRADEFGDPIDAVRPHRFKPNFSSPGNSIFETLPDVQLAPFDPRNPNGRGDIEQAGGENLDSISGRLMHRMAYRNLGTQTAPINAYTASFTVNTSGVAPQTAGTYDAGIRWFELRRTGNTIISVFDQGTHADISGTPGLRLNNWMGSIAMDNRGDVALGYSQSGPNQNADIKIAGRTNNVANSGTLNEGEALFYDAQGSQTSSSNRWGDYSSMNLDSDDDCTFWYTQEYYEFTSGSGFSTRIGKFKFPQCTPVSKATIQGTVTLCQNGNPVQGAFVDSTGGFARLTGANGFYSMSVASGTYAVTASKGGGFANNTQNVTVAAGQTVTVNLCMTGFAMVEQSGDIQIVSESCSLSNSAPDPGETLTINLPLQNTGAANTNNLTATLQNTGGVTNANAPQNYGTLAPGGSQIRTFNFKVDPNLPCGSAITLTFNLNDGNTSYGVVTKTFTTGVQTISLSENFDVVTVPALPAGWSVEISGAGNVWSTSTTTPNSLPNAAFAGDPSTVSLSILISPPVTIQSAAAQISFRNNYNTETNWDGMVLEYSVNGGNWTDVILNGGSFVSGGYNSNLGNGDNPLAGRAAWSGNSNGYVTTVVNLPASLNGQSVRFRWVMGTDESVGATGVRIDDVQIFAGRTCSNCNNPVSCNFQRNFDFDGDSKADISVFRPGTGVWYLLNSINGIASSTQFGASSDKIVPADYDGDRKTDLAVYRNGVWYLQRSTAGFTGIPFGAPDDVPQPADFSGDGIAELAVFRPSTGVWYTYNLVTNQVGGAQFGQNGDKPVTGDYDGDCKADFAVFRPSTGVWYLQQSTLGFTGVQFGAASDKPVPADYDGDSKTDIAVFRPSDGNWYLLRSSLGLGGLSFGAPTDLPVPADYDGDGKADFAVYRPSTGVWYLQRTISGFTGIQFGDSADKPAPNAFIP